MTQVTNTPYEALEVGQTASFSKTVEERDIQLFAAMSGDHNPVHLDAEYAASTMFKERTQRLRRDAVPDHIKIYEAIAARDPAAARSAMVELIDLAFTDAVQLRRKAGASSRRPRG